MTGKYNITLTEGSLYSQRGGLLGFIAKTYLIDSLDTEHVGFSFGQTANHKPAQTNPTHTKSINNQRIKQRNISVQYSQLLMG